MFFPETRVLERGHHSVGCHCAEGLFQLRARRTSLEFHEIDLPFNPRTTLGRYEEGQFGMGVATVTGDQFVRVDGHERFPRLIDAVGIEIHEGHKPIGAWAGAKHPTPGRLQHKVVDQAPVRPILQVAPIVANQPDQHRIRRLPALTEPSIRQNVSIFDCCVRTS